MPIKILFYLLLCALVIQIDAQGGETNEGGMPNKPPGGAKEGISSLNTDIPQPVKTKDEKPPSLYYAVSNNVKYYGHKIQNFISPFITPIVTGTRTAVKGLYDAGEETSKSILKATIEKIQESSYYVANAIENIKQSHYFQAKPKTNTSSNPDKTEASSIPK